MVLTKISVLRGVMYTLLGILLSGTLIAQGDCTLHKKEVRAMEDIFGYKVVSTPVKLAGQAPFAELVHPGDCFFTILRDEKTEGYLLSTSAKGRYDYFDYSILYSADLEVRRVVVSVYRSTHGAGICQKKWLSQFEGYRGGPLKLGADIDGVSGGTLSASAIVADVQRCHRLVSAATLRYNTPAP